jgi:hypothetical protein
LAAVGETFAAVADDDVVAGGGEGSGTLVTAGSPEAKTEAASRGQPPVQGKDQELAEGNAAAVDPFGPQTDFWIAESPFTAPAAVVTLTVAPEAAAADAEAPAADTARAVKEQPLKVNVQQPQKQQQGLVQQGSEPERVETPDVQADPSPGFGFSFPVTPPTDEEEHMLEARAERVFSTWASSHSRASFEIGGASDEEGEMERVRNGRRAGLRAAASALVVWFHICDSVLFWGVNFAAAPSRWRCPYWPT